MHKISNNKQVVNFSIAINDSYKPKGSSEYKEIVTYIDCSYWLNSKSTNYLKKGALVQLFGRIGLNLYTSSDGKAVGSLTFHINNLKILVFAIKIQTLQTASSSKIQQNQNDESEDLPF